MTRSDEIMWLVVQVINATEKKDPKAADLILKKIRAFADKFEEYDTYIKGLKPE